MGAEESIEEEWIEMWYSGLSLSQKKEWNNAICGGMRGPTDCHTERSKSDREDRCYFLWHHLHVKTEKKQYKWTYLQNRVTDVENKFMLAKGKE